jgi:hypothetical protein
MIGYYQENRIKEARMKRINLPAATGGNPVSPAPAAPVDKAVPRSITGGAMLIRYRRVEMVELEIRRMK